MSADSDATIQQRLRATGGRGQGGLLKVSAAAQIDRLETILRKIVEHADDGKRGSHAYAYDRLEQIRALAAYGVERVIGEDCNVVD
jgi:hypothetical protein